MIKNNFNIKEYIENSERIEKYLKPKLRYFIMFLKKELGEDALTDVDFLGLLDIEHLLESLEFYINETSPSKQTAQDYQRAVKKLIELISEDYDIENDIFESVTLLNEFNKSANDRIALLREQINRECMSDEEFELLDEKIADFFSTENIGELVFKSIENEHQKPNYYGQLVSALALRLVQKYGLGNNIIPNLKINDLRLKDRILEVNGIDIFLNEELVANFEIYLISRSIVIQNNNIQTDNLFIKKNGALYLDANNQSDNGALFFFMESAIGHKKVGSFRYRTIIDLVLKGANVNLLSQLTDTSETKIGQICSDNRIELKNNFENILKGTNNQYKYEKIKHNKGELQCPFCGNYKDASSENWILIQISGENKKYLACKECRGRDGKYRY